MEYEATEPYRRCGFKYVGMCAQAPSSECGQFLDVLKSDKSLHRYGYLADMVESDCTMLVREKKEPTTGSKQILLDIVVSKNVIALCREPSRPL